MRDEVINFAAKVRRNLDGSCKGWAAAVFPALSISFTQTERLNYGGSAFTILRAKICESFPKVQNNAPHFLKAIDTSALLYYYELADLIDITQNHSVQVHYKAF